MRKILFTFLFLSLLTPVGLAHNESALAEQQRCVLIQIKLRGILEPMGTGFVERTGVVITNAHIFSDSRLKRVSDLNSIIFVDGQSARIIREDRKLDIVVLATKTAAFEPAVLDEDEAVLDDEVVAVVNTRTKRRQVSAGRVIGVDANYIYTSTYCDLGTSGSPVFRNGKLLGIQHGYTERTHQTVVIPARVLKKLLQT